jgi:23S rRNA pseudouridine2604 synthase
MSIRINKYISEAGICSRREADRKIEMGKVRMNGRLATLGDTVGPGDKVLVDGNLIQSSMQRIYLAYNKPTGVTSTTDKTDPDNIIKAVAYHGGRIFPIGRLDKDSEGLILLTNDGDVVNKILRVSNKHDKEYIVSVDKVITDEFVKKMSTGVPILDIVTRKCTVEKINQNTFKIILNQGLNRQIRRMCKVLGYKVTRLQRIRIMHITVDGISKGTWRFLTDDEIKTLLTEVAHSKSEPEIVAKSSSTSKKTRRVKKPGKWNSEESRVKSPENQAIGQRERIPRSHLENQAISQQERIPRSHLENQAISQQERIPRSQPVNPSVSCLEWIQLKRQESWRENKW